ncbi:MAG: monofunctional biosynthetic peptidoglycan transglycosylase [Desulforhabdus sp.]|nr:monofunctional biosynthetic peptidoglycan transglycosylase [Desulforhabdus sp.]
MHKVIVTAGKLVVLSVSASLWLVVLLRWIDPPTSSFMVQNSLGRLFSATNNNGLKHQWVDYDDISPHIKIAVVAAEDQLFLSHFGFDFASIELALKQNEKGRRLRGASTISQQVAKNLFLWSGRSYLRKGLEAYFTILIEAIWSKRRILEVYLNIAQMGSSIYGVRAASEVYFKQPASQITRKQAALLAAALPNPVKYSVANPSSFMRSRQQWILQQMRQLGGDKYLSDL